MMSETYKDFMIFGLESTGEKVKLDISEDALLIVLQKGLFLIKPHFPP